MKAPIFKDARDRLAKAPPLPYRWTCSARDTTLLSMAAKKPVVLGVLDGELATNSDGILIKMHPMHPVAQIIAHAPTDLERALKVIDFLVDSIRASVHCNCQTEIDNPVRRCWGCRRIEEAREIAEEK